MLDRVRDRTIARTLAPAVDGVVASVGRTTRVLDQLDGRIVETTGTRPPTDVDPAGAVRTPPSRIVDAAAPRPQPPGPVLADPAGAGAAGAGAGVAERAVPCDPDPGPAPDLRPAADTGTGRASSAPSAASPGVDDVDVDAAVDVAAGKHPAAPPVGPTAPSGSSAASASTGTAPLAAYLDHDLLGLRAGTTQPAGHADWILPGSLATVPGSSPD